MIASLAKLIDWATIQVLVRAPQVGGQNARLEEAMEFLNGPEFMGCETEAARVEFDSKVEFRFASPRLSEFAENNVVYGRLYRCGERWRERPVIVLLHGAGDWFSYRFRYPMMARQCNRAGFNAATLVAPYHFQRRPREPGAMRWPNYLRMAQASAQAVAEIRALTRWLLQEGCPAVCLWGYSYGGRLAGMAACRDARLGAVVLVAPSVRLNVAFPKSILSRQVQRLLQAERPAWEMLNRTPFNFASMRPVIPKGNVLLVEPMYDLFVGTEGIEDLWQSWGQPEIWRLRHGHVSKVFVPGLTRRVLRWLQTTLTPALSHRMGEGVLKPVLDKSPDDSRAD